MIDAWMRASHVSSDWDASTASPDVNYSNASGQHSVYYENVTRFALTRGLDFHAGGAVMWRAVAACRTARRLDVRVVWLAIRTSDGSVTLADGIATDSVPVSGSDL
ncbi:MAG: hypothetical protein K6T83_08730 [Alicyclobacillus sp.]|nr:hypothetical protein [Alicyclobacillus sp.]